MKGSASALAESPVEVGVLYVGTTDGAVWVTRNGGHEWTNIYGKKAAAEQQEPGSDKQQKKPAADEAVELSADERDLFPSLSSEGGSEVDEHAPPVAESSAETAPE